MVSEDVIIKIRDYLRADTTLRTFVGERVYLNKPSQDVTGDFITLRDITTSWIDDVVDLKMVVEIKIVGHDKNTSSNQLLPASKRIFELLHKYKIDFWDSVEAYKWIRVTGPRPDDEWDGIKSMISDYKFYFVT